VIALFVPQKTAKDGPFSRNSSKVFIGPTFEEPYPILIGLR